MWAVENASVQTSNVGYYVMALAKSLNSEVVGPVESISCLMAHSSLDMNSGQ